MNILYIYIYISHTVLATAGEWSECDGICVLLCVHNNMISHMLLQYFFMCTVATHLVSYIIALHSLVLSMTWKTYYCATTSLFRIILSIKDILHTWVKSCVLIHIYESPDQQTHSSYQFSDCVWQLYIILINLHHRTDKLNISVCNFSPYKHQASVLMQTQQAEESRGYNGPRDKPHLF